MTKLRNAVPQRKALLLTLLALSFIAAGVAEARRGRGNAKAAITEPQPGAMVENRRSFPVAWSLIDYDPRMQRGHRYWMSLATVFEGLPDKHWPKFFIKSANGSGRLFDGGHNPLPPPQPMQVLLLEVDREQSELFSHWHREGQRTGNYEGLPVDPDQIVARVEIFFP